VLDGWVGDVCAFLSKLFQLGPSSVQIFLYIESARHLAYLDAQRFAIDFISQKNLKEPRVRARAPAYVRVRAHLIWVLRSKNKKI